MLTTILKHDNVEVRNGLAYLLSSIDFKQVAYVLSQAKKNPDKTHVAVLMEYVQSPVTDTIAEIERIPKTTVAIHDFLSWPPVRDALEDLFISSDNIALYTRRRIDIDDQGRRVPSKVRELILCVRPEMPSPILNPEDVSDDDLPPLV